MTFQYFLGVFIFCFVGSYIIMVLVDNLLRLFPKPFGWRYLKVWFKHSDQ